MSEVMVDILTRQGFEGLFAVILLNLLRPLGFLYGFIPISWALGNTMMIRMGCAVALGMPMILANAVDVEALIAERNAVLSSFAALKEFALGYGFGLLVSLPFLALQYGGAVTDAFRGENDGGQPDPNGGTLQTFSVLYIVIGIAVFFAAGGLWQAVRILYLTYDIWPVSSVFPAVGPQSGMVVIDLLQATMVATIQVAVPLLALLVAIEMAIIVAARLVRRFGFYDLAFPAKNLATVLTLPLVAWFVWAFAELHITDGLDAIAVLQAIFR